MDYYTGVRHMDQWGTASGDQLREFLKAAGRPLIWADSDDSESSSTRPWETSQEGRAHHIRRHSCLGSSLGEPFEGDVNFDDLKELRSVLVLHVLKQRHIFSGRSPVRSL